MQAEHSYCRGPPMRCLPLPRCNTRRLAKSTRMNRSARLKPRSRIRFDPSEIKWRVTNTTSDRRRGQVIAYADPRAYTDRLNALFTVRGWTREYGVQVIQNFERKDRGNGENHDFGKDCRDLQVDNRWPWIAQRPGRGVGR